MDRNSRRTSNHESQENDRNGMPRGMYREIGSSASRGDVHNGNENDAQPTPSNGTGNPRILGEPIELSSSGDTSPDDDVSPKRVRVDENSSENQNGQNSANGGTSRENEDNDNDSESESESNPDPEENVEQPAERREPRNVAEEMMRRMGHREGEGLGRYGQGIVDPVEASTQKGRRGFGQVTAQTNYVPIPYDREFERRIMDSPETVEWLITTREPQLNKADMRCWMQIGEKKLRIDKETHFCDGRILREVLNLKELLDNYTESEVASARSRANPYENVKNGIFLNRAAMKMANLESILGHCFSEPRDHHGVRMCDEKSLIYFADVCAGPGGFSEYILWLNKWRAKGFGFTLKGHNDFKIDMFLAGNPETFDTFYGVEHDGDIMKPKNLESFRDFVMANTDNVGVQYMLADGGFSVAGQENIQEILSKQLYLCQLALGLLIVRVEGTIVCKLFDAYTPFTAGLIYLMYRSFHRIAICKPRASRPASSERYLICQNRKEDAADIADYLLKVTKVITSYVNGAEQDIFSVVPLSVMKADERFMHYLVTSNNEIGSRQANALAKIMEYLEDKDLREEEQDRMKSLCYAEWNMTEGVRKDMRSYDTPDTVAAYLTQIPPEFKVMHYENMKWTLKSTKGFIVQNEISPITETNLRSVVYPIHDWYVTVAGTNRKIGCFLGLGHGKNYFYNLRRRKWEPLGNDEFLELVPDTMIFGEIVQEVSGELFSQRRVKVLHLIDAFALGGTVVNELHYKDRMEYCALYIKAVTKSRDIQAMPMKMKVVEELDNFRNIISRFKTIVMKNGRSEEVFKIGEDQYYVPKGFIFIKATRPPFERHLSSKHVGLRYYWAPGINAIFEADRPMEAIATFRDSVNNLPGLWLYDEYEQPTESLRNVQRYLDNFVMTTRNLRKRCEAHHS